MTYPLREFCKREQVNYRRKVTSGLIREYTSWYAGLTSPVPFDEIFTYPSIFSEETPAPGKSGLVLVGSLAFDRGELEAQFRAEERKKFINYPFPNDEELQKIHSLRQSAREEFQRYPALVGQVCEKTKDALKVWLHFTVINKFGSALPPALTIDDQAYVLARAEARSRNKGGGRHNQTIQTLRDLMNRFDPIQILYLEASTIWHRAGTGYSNVADEKWGEAIEDDIRALSEVFDTPVLLIDSTINAMMEFVPEIRSLMEVVLTLDIKLSTYDLLVHNALSSSQKIIDKDIERITEWVGYLDTYLSGLSRRSYDMLVNRLEKMSQLVIDDDIDFSDNKTLFKAIEQSEYLKSGRTKEHKGQDEGGNLKVYFNRHLKKMDIGLIHGREDFRVLARAFRQWKRRTR